MLRGFIWGMITLGGAEGLARLVGFGLWGSVLFDIGMYDEGICGRLFCLSADGFSHIGTSRTVCCFGGVWFDDGVCQLHCLSGFRVIWALACVSFGVCGLGFGLCPGAHENRDCICAVGRGCDVQRFVCQGSVFGLFNLRV